MSITKKHTSRRASRSSKKNEEPNVTIVFKSKASKSSFPEKTDKANKLLSKAKLIK